MTETETRQRPPGVAEYLAEMESAFAAWRSAGVPNHPAPQPCHTTCDEQAARARAIQAWHAARRAADEAYTIRAEAAREALKTSADPLVRWIAENALRDTPGPARVILEALPATLNELDAIAMANAWCVDWELWRARAIEAGVIEDPVTPARRAVLEWVESEAGPVPLSRMRRLNNLLDALAAESAA